MNLPNFSQESHGQGLGNEMKFNPSPTLSSPHPSPLSSLSSLTTSSTSPMTSDGEVSETNFCFTSVGDNYQKRQGFSSTIDVDKLKRQHFTDWTSESPNSPSTAPLYSPNLNSHPESCPSLHPLLSPKALATGSAPFYRPQSSDLNENFPTKSGYPVCCWKSCGKKFSNLKELAAHVNDDHVRIECPDIDFQCQWQGCPRQGRGFNARYKMLIHIRTHTNEKPHTCVVCNKTFSRLENLKIHTRSHTGEKPYICSYPGCGKAYSNSSDRFKHVRTHQEEKPYKCKMPGCSKQYTDPSSLRKHVRTHGHFGPTEVLLHHSFISDVSPKEDDDFKLEEDYNVKRHCADGNTDFNDEHFCDINNHRISSPDLLRKQRRMTVHYGLDVKHNIPSSVEEKRILSKSFTDYENTVENVCKMEFVDDRVNMLNWFRYDDNEISNLERFKITGDRLCNSNRFRFSKDKFNNLNKFTDHLCGQNQNINSDVDRDVQELNSVINNKDESRCVQNIPSSEKVDSVLDYYSQQKTEQQNEKDNMFANESKVLVHCKNSLSDFSQKFENVNTSCTQDCSDKLSINLSNDVSSECDKKLKFESSSPTLVSSNQSLKNSPTEHWKKRKILHREKEVPNLVHSPTSLTQQTQTLRSHSPTLFIQQTQTLRSHSPSSFIKQTQTLRSHSPPSFIKQTQTLRSHSPSSFTQQTEALRSHSPTSLIQQTEVLKTHPGPASHLLSENPETSSVSLLPDIPPTIPTHLIDIPSSISRSLLSQIPHILTATTADSKFVPFSQQIQQLLPAIQPSPSFQEANPSLYLTHPSALQSLLPNSYSSIQSIPDTRIYPSIYMPSLSSLTVSSCSVVPLPSIYHLNRNTYPDLCPTYLLPPETSFHHLKLPQPGAKETWENINPNYFRHTQDLEDTSVQYAANLGHLRLSYQDSSLNLSPFQQCCRTLFPLHLGIQR